MFRIALFLFAASGIVLIVLGGIYLSRGEFMPYHAAAIQADWGDLDANYQGLILGLLKGLGSGAFVVGAGIVFMSVASLLWSVTPYRILLPGLAVGYSSLLCYATYTVYVRTPAEPPLGPMVVLVGVSILAATLLALASRS